MRYLIVSIIAVYSIGILNAQSSYHRTLKMMGSRFDITVVADDEKAGNEYLDLAIAEVNRIEKLISSWDPNSQTTAINSNASVEPVIVDAELFQLIERALNISRMTAGAFDISYASMDRIWQFDGSMTEMPAKEVIAASVAKVGFENVILDKAKSSVFLKIKGMKIGFGAIGKGYAADKAKALLQSKGVQAGIINAAGDLHAWGVQPDGTDWKVAITNPLNKEKAFAWMPIKNSSVVTSGNYEKFVKFDGVRYAHIIDPRTGYPSQGIISVSVFAPSAELADALATSLFVMGKEVGLHFIEQLPNIECIIIEDNNKIITSSGINLKNEG